MLVLLLNLLEVGVIRVPTIARAIVNFALIPHMVATKTREAHFMVFLTKDILENWDSHPLHYHRVIADEESRTSLDSIDWMLHSEDFKITKIWHVEPDLIKNSSDWCSKRCPNPLSPNLTNIIDYLSDLFHSSYTTAF